MRRGPTALALFVSLWLCAAEIVLAQKPSAERPTYEVGMRWLLNDGAYDLIRISKDDVYVFSAGPSRQIELTRDLGVYRIIKGGQVDWQIDPAPPIKWPLEIGKFGSLFNAVMHSKEYPSGLPVRFTWSVKAFESVQVPAGTYQAFRIEYFAEYIGDPLRRTGAIPGRQSWTLVLWYAPETRQFVKAEGAGLRDVDFQLVAAESGTPAPLQILLNDPKDQAHVTTAEAVVGGKVTAGAGVARLSATINGAEVVSRAERSPPAELAVNFAVPLREGKNVLLVTVTDTRGQSKQEARVIFRDRAAAATPVAPAPAPVPAPAAPASLQVTISSPRDQARVDQESIALAGIASSGKGVRRVLVMLNGVEISRLEEKAAARTFPVNLPLKLRDGQNTIVVTATDVDGTTQQEVRSVFFDRVVPLTVLFRHPEDGARLSDQASLVAAEITSGKGVASVNVLLNGTEVFKQADRQPKKSVAVAAPVKLREGTNTIVVRASEPDGTVRQEVRTVLFERPPPVAPVEPAPAARKPARAMGGGGRHRTIPEHGHSLPPLLGGRRRARAADPGGAGGLQEGERAAPHRQDGAQADPARSQVGPGHLPGALGQEGRSHRHLLRGTRRARNRSARHRVRRPRQIPRAQRRGPQRPLFDRPAHGRVPDHLRPHRGGSRGGAPRRLLQRRRGRAHLC